MSRLAAIQRASSTPPPTHRSLQPGSAGGGEALRVFQPDPGQFSARRLAAVERTLGQTLRQARDHQIYLRLGFVRLGDYVAERLGMSLRTAQELIRVEEALLSLPRAAAAFDAGQISPTHVRILARVATKEDEELWVARARRMSVRAFKRAVATALERDRIAFEGVAPAGSPQPGSGAAPAGDDPAGNRRRMPGGEALDCGDESVPLAIRTPVWLLRWWRETANLACRIVGRALPGGATLEVVLAESEDAVADPAPPGSAGRMTLDNEAVGKDLCAASPHCQAGGAPGESVAAGVRKSELQPEKTPGEPVPPEFHASQAPDPRRVDALLRNLVTARQRCEAALADQLACAQAARSHLARGFNSLEGYASRWLGISPRHMYYLLSLHRTLEHLADLRRAFLAGRLTLRQALLVGRVASRKTVGAWIRRAEAVTLRRLEDEVSTWELLRDERPEVWERLRGGPLPEEIVLVPGHEPRLHQSARDRDGSDGDESRVTESKAGLHMSAPGEPDDAREFLAALHASKAETLLPQRMGTLRMRVDPEVHNLWRVILRRLRADCDGPLEEWEALALIIRRFWTIWDNKETRKQRRENPTLERDGWRCTAPGCQSVGSGKLHEHHIVFRSAGGQLTDPGNLTTLCTVHHQHLLHQGSMRCRGEAPDGLRWELGSEKGRPAFLVFAGDRRIGGAATQPA